MRKLIFILIALISFSQAQTIQYIGAPTTTVISRGNFRTDSIFYLPKRTKTPTDTAAFRYQISDSSLYYWTGYQWTKVQSASSFASVDTNIISTRAWRQKGIDSVQYNVGLKVNISDTSSMLSPYIRHAGYGLTKTSQALSVDTALMATRLRVGKVVDSLGSIIATKGSGTVTSVATGYGLSGGTITTTGTLIADTLNLSTRAWRQKGLDSLAALEISGSGTTNYVPKFTNTRELGNSNLINASSGDLLFGTTLNPYAATNRRTFEMNGTNETVIALKRNDLDGAYLYANANDFRIAQTQNLSMTFYTNNTERMRIFQNGRVFVGLSPTDAGYQFDVNGSGRFQQLTSSTNFLDFAHYFYNGGGTNDIYFSTRGNGAGSGNASIINTVSGGRLSFHTNGGAIRFGNTSQTAATANYLSIESNGEILINTTTDAGDYTLQNNGALYNSGDISIRGTYSPVSATNRGNITLNGTASNIIAFANNSALRGYIFHTDSDFLFYNNTTGGRVGLYTEGTARLWITAGGDLGINTTSPSFKLDVNGTFNVRSNYAYFGSDANTAVYLGGFSTEGRIGVGGRSSFPTADLTFYTANGTNNFERMRITSSGETLFGTTTDAGAFRVQVNGNQYINGNLSVNTTNSTSRVEIAHTAADVIKLYNTTTTGSTTYTSQQLASYDGSSITVGSYFYELSNSWNSSLYLGGNYPNSTGIAGYKTNGLSIGAAHSSGNIRFFSGGESESNIRQIITSSGIIGINTTSPSASAQLDVSSTTRGFLPPRMTTTQRDAISSPAAGLVIYNTTTSKLQVYTTSWTDLH